MRRSDTARSASAQLLDIIKNRMECKEEDVFKLFDELPAVEPDFLWGQWSGDDIQTGAPRSVLLFARVT